MVSQRFFVDMFTPKLGKEMIFLKHLSQDDSFFPMGRENPQNLGNLPAEGLNFKPFFLGGMEILPKISTGKEKSEHFFL